MHPNTSGPLDALTVLELGGMVSAPFCGKILADAGAEVIKIEGPLEGDPARSYGPFPDDVPDPDNSGLFLYLNTSKLGIARPVRVTIEESAPFTLFALLLRQPFHREMRAPGKLFLSPAARDALLYNSRSVRKHSPSFSHLLRMY